MRSRCVTCHPRHGWTRHALIPARQAGTRFTYPWLSCTGQTVVSYHSLARTGSSDFTPARSLIFSLQFLAQMQKTFKNIKTLKNVKTWQQLKPFESRESHWSYALVLCGWHHYSFAVVDSDINFSDHLPLLAVINTQYVVSAPGLSRTKGENKPVQNLLSYFYVIACTSVIAGWWTEINK